VKRHWLYQPSEPLNEVTEYRLADYENAMNEIQHLVDRVNNGDLSFSANEGFSVPRDIDLGSLYDNSDNYHSKFRRINVVGGRNN
jgi:hypothetical protein